MKPKTIRSVSSISRLDSKAIGLTSAAAGGQQLPTYNPNTGLKTPPEESAAAAPSNPDAHSNRDPLARLRDLSGCVLSLNPRDPEVAVALAGLGIRVIEKLDEFVVDAPANDPALEALRKLAERVTVWPTGVRPGDEKFTRTKLAKLDVGKKAPERVKAKRSPSFATASNRLARKLCRQIESCAARGVAGRTPKEDMITKHIKMAQLDISESHYERLLEISGTLEPLSEKTLSQWNGALSDLVLLIDPKFERIAELKTLLNDKSVALGVCSVGDKRSKLQKFFYPALKQLAAR